MNVKQKDSIVRILDLARDVLVCDNDRNYGYRDEYLHKLRNAWEDFIEEHPESLDAGEFLDLLPVSFSVGESK